MQVSRLIWESQAKLVAGDVTGFAAVTPPKVALVASPFVPNLALSDIGTLTLATFTGSTPKPIVSGAQLTFYDAASGQMVMILREPAGGWIWNCTATPGAPETIHGYVVTDDAGAVILGSALLPTPITVSAAGQALILADVRCTFSTISPA